MHAAGAFLWFVSFIFWCVVAFFITLHFQLLPARCVADAFWTVFSNTFLPVVLRLLYVTTRFACVVRMLFALCRAALLPDDFSRAAAAISISFCTATCTRALSAVRCLATRVRTISLVLLSYVFALTFISSFALSCCILCVFCWLQQRAARCAYINSSARASVAFVPLRGANGYAAAFVLRTFSNFVLLLLFLRFAAFDGMHATFAFNFIFALRV